MADKGKTPIFILMALILLSLVLAGGVFYLLQKEKAKVLALQTELSDVKMQQKIAETKLAESKKTISGLELKLQDAQVKIDALTLNLKEEKTAREKATEENERINTQLQEQKDLRSDLENKLIQAQEDTKKLQSQLKVLDSEKAKLEAQIKDLEEQLQQAKANDVELGTIVVGPQGTPASAAATATVETPVQPERKTKTSSLEGKVLVVNKEYSFIVINLGNKDGIDVGNVFAVYHNNKYLGDVKIDKVHDSMSAAGFISTDIKDKVNEGDRVVRKTK